MTNNEWNKILKVLQKELRKVGKIDIADVANYEIDASDFDDGRVSKKLTHEMFVALHTELCARSPKLLKYTLNKINEIVENEGPHSVVVSVKKSEIDPNMSTEAFIDIPLEDEDITIAISNIEKTYREIFECEIPGAIG